MTVAIRITRIFMALAVIVVVFAQLTLGTATHDAAEHDAEHDANSCVMAVFGSADTALPALVTDVAAPLTGRVESATTAAAPSLPRIATSRTSRGPPAGRA